MSNTPFTSPEGTSSNSKQEGEEKSHYQQPEFILIDDRLGKNQYTYFKADSSRQSIDSDDKEEKQEKSAKKPMSLRFVCLLGFIFCLIFGLGMLIWSIVMTSLATFSLFQNQGLNQGMQSFWKIVINTFIAGFGFTLGMINPTLGLGLLALYFSLSSDLVGDDLLRKVIKRSFNHF